MAASPEHLIGCDPEFWLRAAMRKLGPDSHVEDDVLAEYIRCFAAPGAVEATCSDYRAGATIDLEHDEASAAGRNEDHLPDPSCCGASGASSAVPTTRWRSGGSMPGDLRGHALECGHFLPKESPDETLAALRAFFA